MLLLLAGCAKTDMDAPADASAAQEPAAVSPPPPPAPAPAQVASPESEPSSPVEPPSAPSTQPYEAPAVPPTAAPAQTPAPSADSYADPKVGSLVRKAASKVDSYSFLYQSSNNWDVIRDKYFIKGDKMKIDLYDINLYNKRNYFDMVYLDMNLKSGVAYCEDRRHQRCIDPEREFEISYEDFMIKTPKEWMLTIPTDAKVVSSETFDKRLTSVIEYIAADGVVVRVWADTFSGLPVQIIIYADEIENSLERYGFRDLSVNSVKAADVEHA